MSIRNTPVTQSIEKRIKDLVAGKKLSDKKIKDFMKKYYDGDPSMQCPTGCKGNCLLDCYIDIHQSLVDDLGKEVPFEKPYLRDSAYHCCGREMSRLGNGNSYCSICGGESKIV